VYQSVQSTETLKFKIKVIFKKIVTFLVPFFSLRKQIGLCFFLFVSYSVLYISKTAENYITLCLLKLFFYAVIHIRHTALRIKLSSFVKPVGMAGLLIFNCQSLVRSFFRLRPCLSAKKLK